MLRESAQEPGRDLVTHASIRLSINLFMYLHTNTRARTHAHLITLKLPAMSRGIHALRLHFLMRFQLTDQRIQTKDLLRLV